MKLPRLLDAIFTGFERWWKTFQKLLEFPERRELGQESSEPKLMYAASCLFTSKLPDTPVTAAASENDLAENPFLTGDETPPGLRCGQSTTLQRIIKPLQFIAKALGYLSFPDPTRRPASRSFRPGVEQLEGLIMPSSWGGHGWDANSGGEPTVTAGVDTGSLWVGEIDNPQANSGGSDGSFSGGIYYFSNLELQAVIDWGDGSNQEGTTISFSGNNPSGNNPAINARQFEVSAGHVYAGAGDYTIGIFVTEHGNDFAYIEDPLTVHENSGGGLSFNLPGTQGNTEGDGVGFNISASAADSSNIVHYWIANQPGGISIDDSGHISGTIDTDASQLHDGVYTVTVTAEDANGDYGSANFSWNVSASPTIVFDPGTRYDTAGSTASSLSIHTEPTTANTTPTYFTMTGAPSGLVIDHQYGVISGNIDAGVAEGTYHVTVTVTDSRGEYTPMTFDWRVFRGDGEITMEDPGDQTNAEGDQPYLSFAATSTDGNAVTIYHIYGQPQGIDIGSDGILTGSIDYAAAETSDGNYSVVVAATDSSNVTSYVDFKWTVTNYDPPPILETPSTTTQAAGTTLNLTVAHDCPDGATITGYGLSISPALPNVLTINGDGVVSGNLPSNAGGIYDVTVTATNSKDLDAEPVDFILIVRDGNHTGPTITTPADQAPSELDDVNVAIVATPPSGHSVAFYQISDQPSGIDIDPQTGEIYGSADVGTAQTDDYVATITVTDDDGGQTTTPIHFNVGIAKPVIDPIDDQTNYAEDAIDVPISAYDPNGYGLTYELVDHPSWLSLNSNHEIVGTVPDSASTDTPHPSVSVTVTNSMGIYTTDTIYFTISQDSVAMDGDFQLGAVIGQSIHLNLATFTDANPGSTPQSFSTVSITWTGGATPAGSVTQLAAKENGLYQVGGTYSFPDKTTYTAHITVTTADGHSATATSTVIVGDLMAGIAGTVQNIDPFTLAQSVTHYHVSAVYSGTETAISCSLVSAGNGHYNVALNFPVDSLDETDQVYHVDVEVDDPGVDGSTYLDGFPKTLDVKVTRPPIALVVHNLTGNSFADQEIATFTEPDLADGSTEFNASINWGDGTTTTGTVQGDNGSFQVLGTHEYSDFQKHWVTVSIGQAWSAYLLATQAAAVQDAGGKKAPFKLTAPEIFKPEYGKDGAFNWTVGWKLDHASLNKTGWIVQDITLSWDISDGRKSSVHYWEAWSVSNGSTTSNDGADHWFNINKNLPGTNGKVNWTATAWYFEGYSLPAAANFIVRNPATFAGPIVSTTTDPKLPAPSSNPVTRTAEINWKSLNGPSMTTGPAPTVKYD